LSDAINVLRVPIAFIFITPGITPPILIRNLIFIVIIFSYAEDYLRVRGPVRHRAQALSEQQRVFDEDRARHTLRL